MLNALPVLLVLIGFPHFGLKPARTPSAADSLPPAWRSASRLALEDQFVLGVLRPVRLRGAGLLLRTDPRTLRVTVAPDSGTVSTTPLVGDVRLEPGAARSLTTFSHESSQLAFARQWQARSLRDVNTRAGTTGAAPTSGMSFKLPSPLPARVQSLLGPGGPALNVAGSENIKLSGQSEWTNQQTGMLGQRRSLFPTLNMQQDLDIRLEGQLSDRVKVNLLQNSANQIPLANRIAINYRGDEDDLVQEFDLGNTNLTLPGTQYVSYSGRNEGLFGVKSTMRFGPLDLTVLASKQEGKSERASYTGGATAQRQTLADYDYVRGIYFFLYDPNGPTLDIDDASIVLYRDNADYTSNVTTVSGRAWVDLAPGDTVGADTTGRSLFGYFSQLKAGSDGDYEILRDIYGPNFKIIRLNRQMSGEQRLAVTYRARYVDAAGTGVGAYRQVGSVGLVTDPSGLPAVQMKLLRAPASKLVADATGRYFEADTAVARFNAVRELELRNFYQLAGQGIDPSSFSLMVHQGYDDPPKYSTDSTTVPIPYLEAVGLDNYDETSGVPQFGQHDGRVDGTVVNTNTLARAFVDFRTGVLFLPDLRPFAPRLDRADKPFDRAVGALLSRRARLLGVEDAHSSSSTIADTAANRLVYDGYNPLRSQSTTYFFDLEFMAAQAQGEISLGRSNILENSEVVTVNGEQWVRDRDYIIDYDIGTLNLKRQIPTGQQLNVNYSYAPLFQQAGRTLLGSAFSLEGRDRSFGGAFMYESKGKQELRPRLGEEPSRSIITDLNTDWTFRPSWMTHLVDRLPGIRTTAPSSVRAQAEVGVSFPNPNTIGTVYIDDMEGSRDAFSLSMSQERWRSGSVPMIETSIGDQPLTYGTGPDTLHNVELRWYSPPNYVKERDLKPRLSDAEGGGNPHQVLCLSVPRRPKDARSDARLWAGVTTLVDQAGLDLSRAQFIELWVNDFNDLHSPGDGLGRVRGNHLQLHIDLGSVSEDQMRSPDRTPNRLLDSEDLTRDNVLTVAEDTGLDGLANPDSGIVKDLVTAGADDPEGDDFRTPDAAVTSDLARSVDPRLWLYVNGAEDNRTVRTVPDTEDLNLNGALDVSNDYIEYTIDLGDTSATPAYLETDVLKRWGPGSPDYVATVGLNNGWRRYRIPLTDPAAKSFGNPNLALVQHVRVWVQGVVQSDSSSAAVRLPLLMLGGLDIVGNRWEQTALDSVSTQVEPVTTLTLNTVNTVDNKDIYVAPFPPGVDMNGSQAVTRREQSVSMEFTELKPGSTLEAYKTFSIDENYSRYGKLNWYVAAYDIQDSSGSRANLAADPALCYFVRFASDEAGRNYYEYRAPLPGNSAAQAIAWDTLDLKLTELSNLKLNSDFPKTGSIYYPAARVNSTQGESLFVQGSPSFTRLRRVSFGLINRGTHQYKGGQLWMNELRATDVAKDVDHAQRVQVTGQLADLMNYSLLWNGRGADFLSVGDSRGSGTKTEQLSWNTSIQTHKFFAQTGIALPVNFSYGRSSSMPRFSAGSDIVRSAEMQKASESKSVTRSFSTSYSRAWSERSNPLLRYTIGGITGGFSWSELNSSNPSSVNRTVTQAKTVNYVISPRRLLSVPVPLSKVRFYPLPERAFWNWASSQSHARHQERFGDQLQDLRLLSDVSGRISTVDFGADTRPFDFVRHHIDAHRNLMLPPGQVRSDHIGFVNLGRVTSWRQSMDANYTLSRGRWLKPQLSWSSSYSQNNGPELSKDLSVRAIGNTESMEMSLELPFERFFGGGPARGSATAPSSPRSGPDASRQSEAEKGRGPGRGGEQGPGAGLPMPARPGGAGAPGAGPPGTDVLGPDERPEAAVPGPDAGPEAVVLGPDEHPEASASGPAPPPAAKAAATPDTTRRAGVAADTTRRAGVAADTTRRAGMAAADTTRRAGMAVADTTRYAGMAVADTTRRAGMAVADTTRRAGMATDTTRYAGVAAADTTRGRRPKFAVPRLKLSIPSWRTLLGSIGNVTTTTGFSRSSAYSQLKGTPSFAYLFGFSSRFDSTRLQPGYGNNSRVSTDWRSSIKSRVRLPFGSSATPRFDFTQRESEVNSVTTRSRTVGFPSFDMEYGRVARVLRLDRVLGTPQLRTSYGRSAVTEWANNQRSPTGRSITSNWRPLIGVSGNLKNGTRADLKVERRVSERENLLSGHTVITDRLTTTNFSLSRSYSRGQKVNVLGKQKSISSNVTLGLTGQYEYHRGETISYADASRRHPLATKYPVEDSRLSLNGTGSYSFSTKVTGNLSLGYGQTNDLQKQIKRRNIRVELRAQFTF